MFIHITFTNGSNPFLKYCKNEEEIRKEIKRWQKNYSLKKITVVEKSGGYFFKADEKMKKSKMIWE